MSIVPAQKEIERFLRGTAPEVLCFKGKWGVGKTYAWKEFLQKAKLANQIGPERYAYVSLFGLGSADQLKMSIVENTVGREQIGEHRSFASIFSNPINAAEGFLRQVLAYAKLAPIPKANEIGDAIRAWSFLAVRDQIVCIDDLERKGDALKIKDVLGLVSFLKEERRCKVVIILNDGAFEEKEKDDFETYFEKTVDTHVEFTPTAAECAQIALPSDSKRHKTMREFCKNLQIANIRVVKRIERMVALVEEALPGTDERVLEEAMKTLTLLGWSTYGEDSPSIEFIADRRMQQIKAANAEPSANEKKWGALLDEYGFLYLGEFDKVLRDGLKQGYFDTDRLQSEAQKLVADYEARAQDDDHSKAWRLYHDSFKDNAGDVAQAMYESFKRGRAQITPMNANSTIILLRELGNNDKASELVKLYVDGAKNVGAFDREHWFSDKDVTDAELLAAIEARLAKRHDDRNPLAVLTKIAQSRGWNSEDVSLLARLSSDDWYALFKKIDGEELSTIVRAAFSFGEGEREKTVAERAREALVTIGKENDLNKRRVGKFGINI